MPLTYKVLGQNNPSASGLTTLYTVPSSTQAVCSSISVCNILNTATTYRIAIRPTGEAIANKHYLTYDASLPANDSTILTMGVSLNASDVVSVYAASSGVSFSLFGTEVT
jgi:hypothetical protein